MNRRDSKISLNCSLTAPPTTQDGSHAPNTPEILNTIVNITSQMYQQISKPQPSNIGIPQPRILPSPSYSDISDLSTISSPLSPSSSSLTSPQESHSVVQDFRSQFIKEGLKMKVRQKLKIEPEDSLQEQLSQDIKREKEDLGPADKMKRHKRRERNKVAAEKCRNKKKKETLNLFVESESVERQNARYKEDIARLEAEQRHLINILAQHQPTCKMQLIGKPCTPQPSWHFDDSNTFKVPNLPANRPYVSDTQLKTETEDMSMYGGDFSAVQSDCKMEFKEQIYENIHQPCSFVRSSPQLYAGQEYSNLTYTGYFDSVCLAI